MSGTLYLVGTPIGNLGDLSPRAREILSAVDFIAAEDTRVTLKLLNHFEIKKPLVCYFEHNRAEMGEKLLSRLMAGESCALVSDAGMPAISDPGEDIVRQCAENGITVSCAPGPSAVVTALAMSGLSTQRFTFEGFLSTTSKNRREHLESLRQEQRTMVFYEAPHKLQKTLQDLFDCFGDRRLALCRELTKIHEEIIRTTLSGALKMYETQSPRGEYVLVLEGMNKQDGPTATLEQALELVEKYRTGGMSLKEAARAASANTGFQKNELYRLSIEK